MGQNRELSKFPNAITVLDNGNVGIGITNPQAKLHVNGTSRFESFIEVRPNVGNQIVLNSTGVNYSFIQNNAEGSWSIGYGPSTGTIGTPILTWLSDGKVGIGTTSMSSLLHIHGGDLTISRTVSTTSTIVGALEFRNNHASAGYVWARIAAQTHSSGGNPWDYSHITFSNWNGFNSLTERMRITNDGSVGIGTASPTARLDVYQSGGPQIVVRNDNAAAFMQAVSTTEAQFGSIGASGIVSIYAGGDRRINVTAAGKIGIGTSSPSTILHVVDTSSNPTILTLGESGETPVLRAGGSNTDIRIEAVGPGGWVEMMTYGSQKMRIYPDGYIQMSSQPSFSMYVSSNVIGPAVVPAGGTIFNDGGYYNTSTYRFTAPITGRYLFTFYDNVLQLYTGSCEFVFRVNGSTRGARAYNTMTATGNWVLISFQQVIKLNTGDYVDVYQLSSHRADYGSQEWGNFSGYLLG